MLNLVKLQLKNGQEEKIGTETKYGDWEIFHQILYYKSLLYTPKLFKNKLISKYHKDFLAAI